MGVEMNNDLLSFVYLGFIGLKMVDLYGWEYFALLNSILIFVIFDILLNCNVFNQINFNNNIE